MTRIRTVVGAATIVATALITAACGNSSGATAASTPTDVQAPPAAHEALPTNVPALPAVPTSPGVPTSPAEATNVPAAPLATAVPAPVARDSNASITADFNPQAGSGSEILAVTNKGSKTLTVKGWPTLTFLDGANGSVSVPVQQVAQPGAGGSITLRPGESAFAGVKLNFGDKGSTDTAVAMTTKITVPGAPAAVVNLIDANGQVAQYAELDLKSVQVGTFQPATQGVNPDTW